MLCLRFVIIGFADFDFSDRSIDFRAYFISLIAAGEFISDSASKV